MPNKCRACASDLIFISDCRPFAVSALKDVERCGKEFKPGKLYLCKNCHLGQRVPCPSEEDLNALYRNIQNSEKQYSFDSNSSWLEAKKIISARDPEQICVLDIGCNSGLFLDKLSNKIQKFGMEPDPKQKKNAEEKGIQIIGDFLHKIDKTQYQRFDYVCLFDVFEHLIDPLKELRTIQKLIKPGGSILLSTGNLDSWTWKMLKGNHSYLETPQHISFASKELFKFLKQTHQLKVTHSVTVSHTVNSEFSNPELASSLYFGLREGNFLSRMVSKAMLRFPSWSYLKHKDFPLHVRYSKDHIFVELRNL